MTSRRGKWPFAPTVFIAHVLKIIMSHAANFSADSAAQVNVQVNGKPQTCAPNTPLPDFLQQQGMNPRLVAVEYNGEILHRQFWESTVMETGDQLEVVTIVGGG